MCIRDRIRPHFFLNCISLIHGIADNKGETDIVTITSILSDYIRYIYKGSQVLRPLSEEIAHVENYISIQRFRYGEDYFQFDCMVDDGLGDIEIPVLLLQTLVENSFSHGLTPVSYTHLDVYKRQGNCSRDYSKKSLQYFRRMLY